jgi:hypothetical protein
VPWLAWERAARADSPFDEERHSIDQRARDPETLVLQSDDVKLIETAMMAVADRHRELLVLRELDGLSYRELADAMDMPIGTVMSGLSRGRQALRKALLHQLSSREPQPLSARGLSVNNDDDAPDMEFADTSASRATQPWDREPGSGVL